MSLPSARSASIVPPAGGFGMLSGCVPVTVHSSSTPKPSIHARKYAPSCTGKATTSTAAGLREGAV